MNHIPGDDNTDQIRNGSKIIPQSGFLDPQTARNDISASRVVVLPAPFEKTTSYIKGTAKAPEAIINASHQVEYYDPVRDLDNIARFIHTTVPLKAQPDLSSDRYLSRLKKKVSHYLEMEKLVVVLGGEHTISLACWQAHQKRFPELGLLQLDAHADLRDIYEGSRYSHASVMRRILETEPYSVTAVGIRSLCQEEAEIYRQGKVELFKARELAHGDSWIERVVDSVPENVYLTIDADVFDPAVLSAVGTPEPGGLFWWQMIELLECLTARRRVIGFDLVELCPKENMVHADYCCAKLVYLLICMILGRKI